MNELEFDIFPYGKLPTKRPHIRGALSLVTHVDQNWKPLLEGLEQIDIAFDELLDIEGL